MDEAEYMSLWLKVLDTEGPRWSPPMLVAVTVLRIFRIAKIFKFFFINVQQRQGCHMLGDLTPCTECGHFSIGLSFCTFPPQSLSR